MSNSIDMTKQFQVDIENLANIVCSKCGSHMFIQMIELKVIGVISSPTGKEELITIPHMICTGCGTELENPDTRRFIKPSDEKSEEKNG